ncbi:MAG: hypothetical protein ACLFQW_02615 [Spirochaetaceae bacterium]
MPEAEGFRHDPRNADTGVFKGYELYYRIYRRSDMPDSDIDSTIESDMHSYFNGTDDFFAVSRDEMGDTGLSADTDEGYRRFYIEEIEERDNTIPLIGDFETADLAQRFKVDINKADSAIFLSISESYFPYPEFELKRNAISGSSSDFLSFTTNDEDYSPDDNDIVGIDSIASTDDDDNVLIVAVFVVPYGIDKFSPIYANGTSDDMTYIGYFEYQL